MDIGDKLLQPIIKGLETVIFWDPLKAIGFETGAQVPIIVLWLIGGALYLTLKMRFINIRGFLRAIRLVRGKYDKPGELGEVSHFQALTTALSATVGLGNIAGVAVAISIGGPGATFWMIIAGFLGMASKFTECTLGLKYRKLNALGEVSGGPMYYIPVAFNRIHLPRTGKFMAGLFAVLCIGGALAGGNMLQSNQAFAQVAGMVPMLKSQAAMFGVLLAVMTGSVIIGGLKGIARVAEKIVPLMALIYVGTGLFIVLSHASKIPEVCSLIIREAFGETAIAGGFLGVMMTGFRRAAFSSESGIGSASIAHAAAKTSKPISEGLVALLEPFIDTVVICTITALVIVFTGQYTTGNMEGSLLTSRAFGSVISWFPYVLTLSVFLFAFSTMISWSYYGLKSWQYLFGNHKYSSVIYNFIFLVFTVLGCTMSLKAVTDLGDMMILSMAIPNLLALFILANEVKRDLHEYFQNEEK